MQMEECSANLARSTSDGSADMVMISIIFIIIFIITIIIIIIIIIILLLNLDVSSPNQGVQLSAHPCRRSYGSKQDYPPTHRWSSVLDQLNILPFASHMVTA